MSTRIEATVEDLARVPGKAELVDGRLVRMSPAGGFHGNSSLKIVMSLYEYSQRTGIGHALGDNVGYLVDLPRRKSFSPDAAFFLGPLKRGFLEGAPVFAVEVRSDRDKTPKGRRDMAAKRADYFAAGSVVVWDVDPFGEIVVRSYRADAPDEPETYLRGQLAGAEPALPGWRMPVDDILS